MIISTINNIIKAKDSNANYENYPTHILGRYHFILAALMLLVAMVFSSQQAMAAVDVYEFDNPRQEAQYKALIEEFRCPKCQNQNLAGSDSQIAQDLKYKTYQMVMEGQSDQQIREYMYERYGDFISYKPPVRPSTWILWFFPPLFLFAVIAWWLWRSANQNKSVTAQPLLSDSELSDSEHVSEASYRIDTNDTAHDSQVNGTGLSIAEKAKLDALLSAHKNKSESK